MNGKLVAGVIVAAGLIAGAAMYYLQVYAYYERVPATGEGDVRLASLATGAPEPILYDAFQAIDADSSPVRYRACFTTPLSQAMLSETYVIFEAPVPLTGPGWFGCYDAAEVDAALADGSAIAFLGQQNVTYGIDRVVAILDDGRGFAWNQINHCGEVVFEGKPAPEGCPPVPERN